MLNKLIIGVVLYIGISFCVKPEKYVRNAKSKEELETRIKLIRGVGIFTLVIMILTIVGLSVFLRLI
ncbi:hypothetical protein [Candidatus Galacturonibacter soehngenii]|uniref:Uncharacterized protein n=1 Tax=Candidatus Galacturonatibacter soehngenii TaxID=2307010 RepID=A0A7V7UH26_9FIRM|nr:hypothetical protein [Candidatus Galacturonibacter soehngenii]KAB1439573.1 hypothetical protein F7O84_04045 [Candidatus Galacturonibacter soehngenii]MBA4687091.1 hypothetical protein [Candidatus Galacturonibacter soehngenii]